jgi:hypothetical protein
MGRPKEHGDGSSSPGAKPTRASGGASIGKIHGSAAQELDLGRSGRSRSGSSPTGAAPNAAVSGRTTPSGTADPSRQPRGPRTDAHPTKRRDLSLRRENEAADALAQHGYDVEQNPPPKPNGKAPDYRIEGEYFDCYAPESGNPEKIRNKFSEKLSENQADRFILNMNDTPCSLEEVAAVLRRRPIAGAREILVVKDGRVVPFYPFGE